MSVTIDHSTRRNIPEDLINNALRASNLVLLLYDIVRPISYIVCIYSYTEHRKAVSVVNQIRCTNVSNLFYLE